MDVNSDFVDLANSMTQSELAMEACGVPQRLQLQRQSHATLHGCFVYFDFLAVARCAFHSKRHIGNIAAQTAAILTSRGKNK